MSSEECQSIKIFLFRPILLLNTHKAFNSPFDLKSGVKRGVIRMSGFFSKKKRPLVVPPPPHELPEFPSPSDSDLSDDLPNSKEIPLDDLDLPKDEMPIEKPEFHEREVSSTFVRLETLQSVVDDVHNVRSRLEKSARVVVRLEEVHEEQNNLLQSWHNDIKTMHDKLIYVDEVLFKGG